MPLVSVVIPTYNRQYTLQRAIESVIHQTDQNWELIIVDDGSTDHTVDWIRHHYPRAKVFQQCHQGVSAARNHGIRQAKGDWIAFLDSDDAWLPAKLAHQMSRIRQDASIAIAHTNEIWIRKGVRVNAMKKHVKKGGWIFQHCLPLCAISPSSVIIHRQVFDHVGVFDETLPACEDYDLWLRIAVKYPVHFIETPLIEKYGGHSDQLSACYWGMDRFRIKSLHRLIQSGTITSSSDQQAAIAMLQQKSQIFIKGAIKHGNTREAVEYEAILNEYQN